MRQQDQLASRGKGARQRLAPPPPPAWPGRQTLARVVPVLGGLALGIGAGLTLERLAMLAERRRRDPAAGEPFGRLRGTATAVTSADGTTLHVEELGVGPAVVFAHGFSLRGDAWHYQRRDLPPAGWRCVFPDARGHGRSGEAATGDYSIGAFAADLAAVLAHATGHQGAGPVALVAHSMNGFAALSLAAEGGLRRHGVAALVLVNTAYSDGLRSLAAAVASRGARTAGVATLSPAYQLMGRQARIAFRFRRRGSDLGYLGTRMMGFGPNPSPSQVAFTDRLLAGTRLAVWARILPGLVDFDLTEALERLDVPTLVVAGEVDRVTLTATARHMAATIPDAELLLLPGVGHMAFMEASDAFNTAVTRFARAHLPGAPPA